MRWPDGPGASLLAKKIHRVNSLRGGGAIFQIIQGLIAVTSRKLCAAAIVGKGQNQAAWATNRS